MSDYQHCLYSYSLPGYNILDRFPLLFSLLTLPIKGNNNIGDQHGTALFKADLLNRGCATDMTEVHDMVIVEGGELFSMLLLI